MRKTANRMQGGNKTLLCFDWDNFFGSLFRDFGPDNVRLEERVDKIFSWVNTEVGKIISIGGFVFAPEHLNILHKRIFLKHDFNFLICPKKEGGQDVVDENIISFCEWAMKHPEVGYLCLASGDNDYFPLFEKAGKLGVKRALVVPTLNCLAKIPKGKRLVDLIDSHPLTGRKMVLRSDLL